VPHTLKDGTLKGPSSMDASNTLGMGELND